MVLKTLASKKDETHADIVTKSYTDGFKLARYDQ